MVFTLGALLEASEVMIDAGSSAFALGKVLGMAKGLAEVLAHELGKLDVEGGKEEAA